MGGCGLGVESPQRRFGAGWGLGRLRGTGCLAAGVARGELLEAGVGGLVTGRGRGTGIGGGGVGGSGSGRGAGCSRGGRGRFGRGFFGSGSATDGSEEEGAKGKDGKDVLHLVSFLFYGVVLPLNGLSGTKAAV